MKAVRVNIYGIVQGVGFRPFVFGVAKDFNLTGYILNTKFGAEIQFEGKEGDITSAIEYIKGNLPNGAVIDNLEVIETTAAHKSFDIKKSSIKNQNILSVAPDIGICNKCVNEMYDKNSRFYMYPYISCSGCGPRYTILKRIPYDRKNTSMREFEMCNDCKKEYRDPNNRRFHAQTFSCPKCGPRFFEGEKEITIDYIADLISDGKIVAIKGVGGFHFACSAKKDDTVRLLRDRKKRPHKPFALMMSLEDIKKNCEVSVNEEQSLNSTSNPIVLLKQKKQSDLSGLVNPNIGTLGVMLPYTGFHMQLIDKTGPLIMTSANTSDEPIITGQAEKAKLLTIADTCIHHDREIINGCDDSVLMHEDNKNVFIRRSRGFVPKGIKLNKNGPNILASGSDLKNTFAIHKGGMVYPSQYIGDLQSRNNFDWYIKSINYFKEMLNFEPQVLVCDYHPDFQSTKYAKTLNLPTIKAQHHHSHVVSVMAENNMKEDVIGVCFDGTGFGMDEKIWGGEFFIANTKTFDRIFHFEYVSMPGNELAIKEPYRMGLSYLYNTFKKFPDIEFVNRLKIDKNLYLNMLDNVDLFPYTSSVGRLFDAVSSILGVRDIITYEGQAAIELENIATDTNHRYDFSYKDGVIFTNAIIEGIVNDLNMGTSKDIISSKFHNTMSGIVLEICKSIKNISNINKVVLAGGVFQNRLLLSQSIKKLNQSGFLVYYNNLVPINDGGISLGQVLICLENV